MPKHTTASDNSLAATPDPTGVNVADDAGTAGVDETVVNETPYTPDGVTAIGTPPVNGAGGERGSSAFAGTALFNTDGSLKDVRPDTHFPLKGTDYYTGTVATGNHA